MGWFKVAEVLHLAGGRQSLVELLEEEGDELPRVYHTFIGDKDWADGIIKEYGGKLDEEISAEWEMRRGVCDVDKVIRLVAREYGLTKNELLGNRISNARKVCVYLLSKYTPLDADAIGELLGMSKWAVFKTVHRLVGCKKEMKIVGKLKRQLS